MASLLMNFDSEPSAVSSSEDKDGTGDMTNLVIERFSLIAVISISNMYASRSIPTAVYLSQM